MADSAQLRLDRLYASAHRAGFLAECKWSPASGINPVSHWVNFDVGGQRRFDGIAIAVEAAIRFPSHWFPGIRKGDGIAVGGGNYFVAEIMVVGGGGEKEATLRKAP